MPPVVASTTFCMHNNQMPAGRELGFKEYIPNGPGFCHASGFPGLEFILHQTMESDLIPTEACHC